MKRWNKRILTVLMQWDYGDKSRGVSGDKLIFFETFKEISEVVEPFWYDEYLNDLPLLQERLLKKAAEFKPDLIFFLPFSDQFTVETLDALKAKCPTVAWFGDDTWRFDNYTSRMAPHYSYPATTDPFSVAKYKKLGLTPIVTQWAAQASKSTPDPLPPVSYDFDVTFIGGYNRFRAWYIERLAKAGIKVSCFGAGWPAGKVSLEEMERIFYKTKINLNLSNSVNQDIRFVFSSFRSLVNYVRSTKRAEQIKARNFEIPLAGGFQLTNYAAGIERYFKIGEEIAVFSSPEECAQQIAYYLANEVERLSILRAGYKRAKDEHTYIQRFSKMLEYIWGPSARKPDEV